MSKVPTDDARWIALATSLASAERELDEAAALSDAITEHLPEYTLDDGTDEPANDIERVEFAGLEIARLRAKVASAERERDELRGLLREARKCLGLTAWHLTEAEDIIRSADELGDEPYSRLVQNEDAWDAIVKQGRQIATRIDAAIAQPGNGGA